MIKRAIESSRILIPKLTNMRKVKIADKILWPFVTEETVIGGFKQPAIERMINNEPIRIITL